MFDKLASAFSKSKNEVEANDPKETVRAAVAALLVEAARIDGRYDPDEARVIDHALARLFDLDENAATALRQSGETDQENALDLHQFTKHAKALPYGDRLEVVERMWEVVLSDDDRDPLEDMLMRRLCGLIHIEDRDNAAARARALAKPSQS